MLKRESIFNQIITAPISISISKPTLTNCVTLTQHNPKTYLGSFPVFRTVSPQKYMQISSKIQSDFQCATLLNNMYYYKDSVHQ